VSVGDFDKPQSGSYTAELDEQARRKVVPRSPRRMSWAPMFSSRTRSWRSSWQTWSSSGTST
jgi:hypothetical protein